MERPLSALRVGFSIAATPSRQPGNRRAHTPRDIVGLDPVGLEGLSANLLAHAPRECRGGDAEGGPCSLPVLAAEPALAGSGG